MNKYFHLLNEKRNFSLDHLKNTAFLITGATGLIGSIITRYLFFLNEHFEANINLILLVRDIQKAQTLLPSSEKITYVVKNIESFNQQDITQKIDYIIHCAAPTKSKFFIQSPVETLDTIISGTRNLLQVATKLHPRKVIFLSSMEAYGILNDIATEKNLGFINLLSERSSYSEGKRIAELYCYSFYSEYKLPVIIARPAMCFGPGILLNETRAYKAFIDQAQHGNNIVLKSDGSTKLNYISTLDIINSILVLLEKGKNGEIYNLNNSDSGIYSILDMAEKIASIYNVNTCIKIDDNAGLAPNNTMILSNKKIQSLGVQDIYNIEETIKETIKYVENQ